MLLVFRPGEIFSVVFLALFFSSCVTSTNVSFNTDIEGAEVMLDGMKIGITPTQSKLSNAIWEDPDVFIRKEGYRDLYLSVKKEIKVVNVLTGVVLSPFTYFIPLLWCYGPKKNQNYVMIPEIQ